MSVGVWAGLASSGGLFFSQNDEPVWQGFTKKVANFHPHSLQVTLLYYMSLTICESFSHHFVHVSPTLFHLLPWLLRRSQTCPGDHHRGRKTARLPPHSVEPPFICSHYPVHPQMENCESLSWFLMQIRNCFYKCKRALILNLLTGGINESGQTVWMRSKVLGNVG